MEMYEVLFKNGSTGYIGADNVFDAEKKILAWNRKEDVVSIMRITLVENSFTKDKK